MTATRNGRQNGHLAIGRVTPTNLVSLRRRITIVDRVRRGAAFLGDCVLYAFVALMVIGALAGAIHGLRWFMGHVL